MSELSLMDIKKKFDKDFPNMLYSGHALDDLTVPRLPSNMLAFDLATGGGIPEGRFTIFHGAKSSGKSNIALKVAGNYLKNNPDKSVLWTDFEHSYEPEWSSHFIDNPERFVVVRPDYGEQGVDATCELAVSNDVGLIVIDSLAMITPIAMSDASANDEFMGNQTKLINKLLRKLMPIVGNARREGRTLTIILTNQVRANFGARAFGPQTIKPGGYFQDHVASMDVKFYPGKYTKSGAIPYKATHMFTLEKNKVGIPKVSGEYTIYIKDHGGCGIAEIEETKAVMEYAKRIGILAKRGGKWYFGDNVQPEFKNLTEVVNALDEDETLLQKVKDAVLDAYLNSDVSEGEEEEEIQDEESL